MIEPRHHPTVGWGLAGLGAAMMVASFVLVGAFELRAPVLHNFLQLGGLALVIVGFLFVTGVFFRAGGDD